jgi:AraC-like DNA-binding protein
MNQIYELLCIIASFQLFLFSIFLFKQKKGKMISNRILCLFFLSKSISILDSIVFYNFNFIFTNCPYLFFTAGSFDFLFAPTLYLYIKSIVIKNFKLRKLDLLHLIPIFIYLFFFISQYHIHSSDTQRKIIQAGFMNGIFIKYILYTLFHSLVFIYMIFTAKLLINYSKELKNNYSSIEKISISWLKIVIIGFFLMWIFYLINYILYLMGLNNIAVLNLLGKLTLVGFSSFIIYKVLINPEVITGIILSNKKNNNVYKPINKRELEKLTFYMTSEKPYLEHNLIIQELAERLSISQRKLSFIINKELKKNFFDFINEYRINEAKTLLSKPEFSKKTILEILYEVGFNSKSVFNSIFKKQTGYTPTEFKKYYIGKIEEI